MSHERREINHALNALNPEPIEVLDLVHLPTSADRMVRMKTLEDVLEHFEGAEVDNAIATYVVRVKKRAKVAPTRESSPAESKSTVYLGGGKLNAAFLLKNATVLLENGDLALARNILVTLLKAGEERGPCLLMLAEIAEKEKNWDEARDFLQESIAFDPKPHTYLRLARLFVRSGKPQAAAELLERALKSALLKDSDRFEMQKLAASSWLETETPAHADGPLEACILTHEQDAEVQAIRARRAHSYLKRRRLHQALGEYQSLPQTEDVMNGGAQAQYLLGNVRLAHDAYAAVLEQYPASKAAIYHIVKLAIELKSYATAARCVEEYLSVAPFDKNLVFSLAGLQFHLSRYEECGASLRQVLQMDPQHSGAKELQAILSRRTDGSRHGTA